MTGARQKWTLRSVAAVAAAAAAWLSVEYWALGQYSAVIVHDNADCTLPAWLALARAGAGAAAHWMPWSMGGFDRLANDYPLDQPLLWLFFVLPGWLAWGGLLFLHSFLAFFGMQRLCADALETSDEAGAVAGAVFAVALARSYIFKNAWGYALLPAALWALDRLVRDRKRSPVWAVAAGAVFGLCSSGPLTLPFTLAAVPVWLWLRGELGARGLACAAGFAAAAAAARYPVFAAMWAEAPLSHRAGAFVESPAFGPRLWLLIRGALAELFPALALAAAGAWAARGRAPRLGRFSAVALAFLVSPAAAGLAVSAAGERLGMLQGFSFDRFGSLLPLWAALCAALAFDLLPAARRRTAAALFAAAALAWSLPPKAAAARDWYFEGGYAALFSAPSVSAVAARRDEAPFRVATVPHGLHPAYASAYGLEAADGYTNLYPGRYRGFWTEVVAPALTAEPGFRRDLERWGSRVYLVLGAAPPPGTALDVPARWRLDLLSLAGVRFVFSRLELSGPGLTLVRRGARPEEGAFRERLLRRLRRNLGGDDGLFVYENAAAMPRAFVVPRAVRAGSPAEALAFLRAADAAAFRERVVVEGVPGPLPSGKGFRAARIVSRSADRLELDVAGAGPGVLVVTDTWTPRRTAEVDGRPSAVYPAWGVFEAVPLAGTEKTVVLAYGR